MKTTPVPLRNQFPSNILVLKVIKFCVIFDLLLKLLELYSQIMMKLFEFLSNRTQCTNTTKRQKLIGTKFILHLYRISHKPRSEKINLHSIRMFI